MKALTHMLGEEYCYLGIFSAIGVMHLNLDMIHGVLGRVHQRQEREKSAMCQSFMLGSFHALFFRVNMRDSLTLLVEECQRANDHVLIGLSLQAVEDLGVNVCHLINEVEVATPCHCRLLH